jgi:hypothetical protein
VISPDWSFIDQLEGFETMGYVPRDAAGEPLGKSGVSVGGGVDLGQWSAIALTRRGVPGAIVDKVAPYCGLRRWDAVHALKVPLVLTEEEARRLTRVIQGDITDTLVANYDQASALEFRFLPQEAQTVLLSVAYQFGPDLATRTPKFWKAMTAGDWQAAVRELEDFGDDYPTRRRKEARYLKDLIWQR